jgi:NAD(P) transhydrogenase subunit alpha
MTTRSPALVAERPAQDGVETMKALVYLGGGKKAFQDKAKPVITAPTDAIVRIVNTTICGTDLHILKGDVPTATPGRTLGHEGVGIVDEAGSAVRAFKKGDRVLISCVTSCGICAYCRRLMFSHCVDGGWILGNSIDGTQADFVRIPHADTSLYPILAGDDEDALVMFSDILPTGYECGVLNGRIAPGSTVAIIGSGPIGLAALLTAQFYSPAEIIVVDLDQKRLDIATRFGATKTVNSTDGNAKDAILALTANRGVDTAIEAVGIPATFELCEQIVAPGGHIANIGVHGKPVTLHLEQLWDRNIDITTRAGRHRQHADAARNDARSQDRSQETDHAPLQTHRHHVGVRYVRERSDDGRAQGHTGAIVFVNVAVLKETQAHERRVALVPSVAPRLTKLGAKLHMQAGAGDAVGLPDSAYADVAFVTDRAALIRDADVVLCVQPPALEVVAEMKEGAILVSFIYADHEQRLVRELLERKITCFAMERIPRITRAQAMDALSSQSALAGYYAVQLGATHMNRVLPKMTTAGGTLGPAKVLVMGLGVAGLEAVATAHRLGAVVEGYDVRPATAEQALSLGATFVDTGIDARGKGGYARELTADEKAKVDAVLTKHIQAADLVVTTAAIPGKPSPKLISKVQVAGMKAGAVIVDLSAEGGGNCEDTEPGATVKVGNVTIVAPLNVPSLLGDDASNLYSHNQYNLLELMLKNNIVTIDWSDEVLAKTMLTHAGKLHDADGKQQNAQSAAKVA